MPFSAAVVLVNFHCADLVADRAAQACAAGYRVVVTDNSGEYEGPGELVRPGHNLGFGVGCNAAVELLSNETWVCLVNPDTLLVDSDRSDHSRAAEVLGDLMFEAEQAGLDVAAPTLRTNDGVIRRGYRRPNVGRELLFTALAVRSHELRSSTVRPPGGPNRGPAASPRMRPRMVMGPRFGSGALLAVRLNSWHRVGGFDDRFVLYGEDIDLWCRLEKSGASVGFVESIEIGHRQGQGSPTPRVDRDVLRWAGVELFVALHHGSRWRPYRRVHQLGLARLASSADPSPVARCVNDAWRLGLDPVATALRLRRAFEQGLMSSPATTMSS